MIPEDSTVMGVSAGVLLQCAQPGRISCNELRFIYPPFVVFMTDNGNRGQVQQENIISRFVFEK